MRPAAEESNLRVLNVDFAEPPKWSIVASWTLVAAGVVFTAWLSVHVARDWRRLSQAKAEVTVLQERATLAAAVQAAQAASAGAAPGYAVDARRWIGLRAVDVGGVLRSVESAQVAGAKVTSLDIDVEAGRVELQLEVASAEVAASYVQALNAGLDRAAWALARLQTQGTVLTAVIHGRVS